MADNPENRSNSNASVSPLLLEGALRTTIWLFGGLVERFGAAVMMMGDGLVALGEVQERFLDVGHDGDDDGPAPPQALGAPATASAQL